MKDLPDYIEELQKLLHSAERNLLENIDDASITELEEEIVDFIDQVHQLDDDDDDISATRDCTVDLGNPDSVTNHREIGQLIQLLIKSAESLMEEDFQDCDSRTLCLLLSCLAHSRGHEAGDKIYEFFVTCRQRSWFLASVKIAWYNGMTLIYSGSFYRELDQTWILPTDEENYLVEKAADRFYRTIHSAFIRRNRSSESCDAWRQYCCSLINYCNGLLKRDTIFNECGAFLRSSELLDVYFTVESGAVDSLKFAEALANDANVFASEVNRRLSEAVDRYSTSRSLTLRKLILHLLAVAIHVVPRISVDGKLKDFLKEKCCELLDNDSSCQDLAVRVAIVLHDLQRRSPLNSVVSADLIDDGYFKRVALKLLESQCAEKVEKEAFVSCLQFFKQNGGDTTWTLDLVRRLFVSDGNDGRLLPISCPRVQSSALELMNSIVTGRNTDWTSDEHANLVAVFETLVARVNDHTLLLNVRSTVWKNLGHLTTVTVFSSDFERAVKLALCDTDWEIRESALGCLVTIARNCATGFVLLTSSTLVEFVKQCLDDKKPFVRARAVELLGHIAMKEACPNVELLYKACSFVVDDGSVFVKRRAALLIVDTVTTLTSDLVSLDPKLWVKIYAAMKFIALFEEDDTVRHLAVKFWNYSLLAANKTAIKDGQDESGPQFTFEYLEQNGCTESLKALLTDDDLEGIGELRKTLTETKCSNGTFRMLISNVDNINDTRCELLRRDKLREMVLMMARMQCADEGLHVDLDCY